LVVENLNQFAEKVQRDIYVIDCKPGDDWASKSSTWFMMR
jgi:hypothetical protein